MPTTEPLLAVRPQPPARRHELIFDPYERLTPGEVTAASMIDARAEAPLADDSGAGLAMFLIFAGAVLIVSGAVAIIALVGTWWALAAGFAAHILLTTVVILTIYKVMSGRPVGRLEAETRA